MIYTVTFNPFRLAISRPYLWIIVRLGLTNRTSVGTVCFSWGKGQD